MFVDVVVGIDAGGTWLRIKVADLYGRVLVEHRSVAGRAELGVPFEELAAAALTDTVAEFDVVAGAGTNAYTLADAWRRSVRTAPFISFDEGLLACGPVHDRTTVIIAGTGSAIGTYQGTRRVRRSGATGPLTDLGCAVWIGSAARAAADAARRGTGPATSLADLIGPAVGNASYVDVAQLSKVCEAAARSGDQVASTLIDTAASDLIAMVDEHGLDDATAVATVGPLTSPDTLVGARLVDHLGTALGRRTFVHHNDLSDQAVAWALKFTGQTSGQDRDTLNA